MTIGLIVMRVQLQDLVGHQDQASLPLCSKLEAIRDGLVPAHDLEHVEGLSVLTTEMQPSRRPYSWSVASHLYFIFVIHQPPTLALEIVYRYWGLVSGQSVSAPL